MLFILVKALKSSTRRKQTTQAVNQVKERILKARAYKNSWARTMEIHYTKLCVQEKMEDQS